MSVWDDDFRISEAKLPGKGHQSVRWTFEADLVFSTALRCPGDQAASARRITNALRYLERVRRKAA